jgi:hypothetical protein
MVIRQIFAMLLGLGLALSVHAQQLRDGHPDEYVVQEGDTLWEIAERFLTNPWDWPAIWQANPQIDNPHLIFPGDVISLIYINGEPRLVLNQDQPLISGEERLSPKIRELNRDEAITTVPLDAIDEFMRIPRVISEDELDELPHVVANSGEQIYSLPGDRVYIKGLTEPAGSDISIAMVNHHYRDADEDEPEEHDIRSYRDEDFFLARRTQHRDPYGWRIIPHTFGIRWPIVGYEMWEIARGRVMKAGDPAIVQITEGRREVAVGDYVLPADKHIFDPYFVPHAMDDMPDNGRVLTLSDNRFRVGHLRVLSINLGADDGVEPGHVFSVFRPGEKVHDIKHPYSRVNPFRDKVKLPDEYIGKIMVFRTFDRISYALMMEGKRAIVEGDKLYPPDEEV